MIGRDCFMLLGCGAACLLACGTEGGPRARASSPAPSAPFGASGAPGSPSAGTALPPVPASGSMPASPASPATTNGVTEAPSNGAELVTAAPAAMAGSSGGDAGTASVPDAPCSGIPIVPDATGFVAADSNSLGIHGSWFAYSDCNDLGGQNCATVTAPSGTGFANVGGKMCTSGQTSSSAGAWGAGLGLELNDGPPQMPYDTVAMGVTGFCFTLSGPTIPSTSLRVAFPTRNHQDDPYFTAVATPGQHSVSFAESAQGSWVTTKSAFEADQVMLLQFQIPSSATAPVPWDFCVEGLTALVE
jgi:hypothetical protein